MPRFDGTGPNGLGPMTGRRMGRCSGSFEGRGRGLGFGRGFRRGGGRNFLESEESSGLQEKIEVLKMEKKELEAEIEFLEKKLK